MVRQILVKRVEGWRWEVTDADGHTYIGPAHNKPGYVLAEDAFHAAMEAIKNKAGGR